MTAVFAGPFDKLIDDAAIFPPGLAPLPDAVRAHRANAESGLGRFVGPIVVPVGVVDETCRLVAEAAGPRVPLSVIVAADDDLEPVRRASERADVEIAMAELRPSESAAGDYALIRRVREVLGAGLPVFVEMSVSRAREGGLLVLAEAGAGLKFRTGGTQAGAFPEVAGVAEIIQGAVAAGVPFKMTAGLHRAVRHWDDALGVWQHGFLNVAAATVLARAGRDTEELRAVVAETDAGALRRLLENNHEWRASFVSFGSCSVEEPVDTLIEAGLLPSAVKEFS